MQNDQNDVTWRIIEQGIKALAIDREIARLRSHLDAERRFWLSHIDINASAANQMIEQGIRALAIDSQIEDLRSHLAAEWRLRVSAQ